MNVLGRCKIITVPFSFCQQGLQQWAQFSTCHVKSSLLLQKGVLTFWRFQVLRQPRKDWKGKRCIFLPLFFHHSVLYTHYTLGSIFFKKKYITHYLPLLSYEFGPLTEEVLLKLFLISMPKVMNLLSTAIMYIFTCIPSPSLHVCMENCHAQN